MLLYALSIPHMELCRTRGRNADFGGDRDRVSQCADIDAGKRAFGVRDVRDDL